MCLHEATWEALQPRLIISPMLLFNKNWPLAVKFSQRYETQKFAK